MEEKIQRPDDAFIDIKNSSLEPGSLMVTLDRFQNAIASDESSASEHIGELVAAIYQQFQYEEYLMETSRYPLDDIHTMEHNRIMSTMIHSLTAINGCPDVFGRVIDRLRIMFRVHSENFDHVLYGYFKKKYSC